MTTKKQHAEKEPKDAYVVGIGVSPDLANEDDWNYYLVYIMDSHHAEHIPVMYDGYIILFDDPDQARAVLDAVGMGDEVTIHTGGDAYAADINNVFYTLESKSEEENMLGNLLDFYNLFFDIARVAGFKLPAGHKRLLWAFANHLTTGGDVKTFLAEKKVSRKRIIDASLWLVGTLFARATFLPNVLRKISRTAEQSESQT